MAALHPVCKALNLKAAGVVSVVVAHLVVERAVPRKFGPLVVDGGVKARHGWPRQPKYVIHRPIQDQILGRVLGRRVDIFLHRGTSVFWSQGHRVDAPQQDSVEGPIEREQRLESVADALALVARDPRRREDDAAPAEYVVNFAEPFAFGI